MNRIHSCVFPNISPELSHLFFGEDREIIIIGVIGKSMDENCNKMAGFDMIKFSPDATTTIADGQISFYFDETNNKILYIHFQTTFDERIMERMLHERFAEKQSAPTEGCAGDKRNHRRKELSMVTFHSYLRTRFAQILLFAIQVCHIIVLVEPSNVFDTSYLNIFKALKVIREKYVLKFLPKFLKNSSAGSLIGKEARLCSPRFIFYFERALYEYSDLSALQKYEFEIEDSIYKMLRNEFIITNNSLNSLFSIPRNKRFVCVNTNTNIRVDPLTQSINSLALYIKAKEEKTGVGVNSDDNDSDDDIRPFKGFAKPLSRYKTPSTLRSNEDEHDQQTNRLLSLIDEHVEEALNNGFDDSIAKFKGKSHFVIPSIKSWYETFKILHKIFIENPDNDNFEPSDPDYKSYLEHFHKIIDVDDRFYIECCEYGLELALENYKEMLPHHYSKVYHEQKIFQSLAVLSQYGRGPHLVSCEHKLRENCLEIWLNGRQQCEFLSLRGNPCVMPKHEISKGDDVGHSSGETIISTCNCGRTQGRRQDPYTLRQANFEFYQIMAGNCTTCNKLEKFVFAIFEPSINDYRAAELCKSIAIETTGGEAGAAKALSNDADADSDYRVLSMASQSPDLNLSLGSVLTFSDETNPKNQRNVDGNVGDDISHTNSSISETGDNQLGNDENDDEDATVNEIVIKVGAAADEESTEKGIFRQASTTEYLSGMIHTLSPIGVLPQFPSWSLTCIGHSSVYAHNSGLPEHIQSGFLSGANFLLPWDVQVRLEHATSWALSYDKIRNRRKPQTMKESNNDGQVFVLKIFIGCEYECPRGHRFFMNSPDKILRGGSGIARDGGSKVVFNDMPLYFPCPCRTTKPNVAQLMRVHIVTPKAPVNIILEPKVRTGAKNSYTFITGSVEPPKLTQSAYWILRLPYIYEGNHGPILPPTEISASTSMMYGCLLAGMYGITETKTEI